MDTFNEFELSIIRNMVTPTAARPIYMVEYPSDVDRLIDLAIQSIIIRATTEWDKTYVIVCPTKQDRADLFNKYKEQFSVIGGTRCYKYEVRTDTNSRIMITYAVDECCCYCGVTIHQALIVNPTLIPTEEYNRMETTLLPTTLSNAGALTHVGSYNINKNVTFLTYVVQALRNVPKTHYQEIPCNKLSKSL